MPLSQAFVELIFSVTSVLTSGLTNRARVTVERGAFLKLKRYDLNTIIATTDFFGHSTLPNTINHTHA